MITNLYVEFTKRFSKNGEHRQKLNLLKELKKKYPKDEELNKLITAFRQKIYGSKGAGFIHEKVAELFENRFPFQNRILEIEGVKFDLTSNSAREVFYDELIDLLCSDVFFGKSEEHKKIHQLVVDCQFVREGPYQYQDVFLNPNDVLIDIGANMGIFSLLANKFYNCKSYAFEPIKSTVNLLNKNIALNGMEQFIEVVPYALSNEECDVEFQIDQDNMGASSFVRTPKKCKKSEKIHCLSLDQWVNKNHISKIDFIKADIEGAERYMLSGATEVLQKFAPKLSICTYHLPDDPQVLEEIILKANPKYKVVHAYKKLFAAVVK